LNPKKEKETKKRGKSREIKREKDNGFMEYIIL